MAMTPNRPDELYLLRLNAVLYGTLMARILYKSNVTWKSYPFLPPTGASGFLAALANGERWIEGDELGLSPRALHKLVGSGNQKKWRDIWVLGAFPSSGQMSNKHFRTHLGSITNYESAAWIGGEADGERIGKKLAVVEEFWADNLVFFILSPDLNRLKRLFRRVCGRVGPVAKKGYLAVNFQLLQFSRVRPAASDGSEAPLGLIPIEEVGQMPIDSQVHRVPLSSRLVGKSVEWQTASCLWADHHPVRFRPGVPVFVVEGEKHLAISKKFLEAVAQ